MTFGTCAPAPALTSLISVIGPQATTEESSLSELLRDPVMRCMMRSDNVLQSELRDLMDHLRSSLKL